ncbi:hypothetical protein VKT23_008602 [Stygiomarasmius scandens]|uniref:Uncharacterized protein n=1 Tax=Marasmiellus scandens TaxID=2682957 RepID=A0ABR1JN05_9AGAR
MVNVSPDGMWSFSDRLESVRADQFESNYLEIIESMPNAIIPWKDQTLVPVMPNPKCALVGKDEDLYVVMIPMWANDVLGNKSKQYNKHINLYTQNSNLPARLLQQEYFVNFVLTSPHASAPEQFAEIRKIVNRANEILEAHPTTSENELVTELSERLNEQPGDKMNPLLDIAGLSPNQDTPVEILHTILLGIVKYTWHMFHSKLSNDTQRRLFVSRLQSTDTDGLTIPPLRAAYMMQYRNGLIGKHFKALMQTMVFHVHDLVTPAGFEVIKAVGELGAMLWVPEINDMDQYITDLEV